MARPRSSTCIGVLLAISITALPTAAQAATPPSGARVDDPSLTPTVSKGLKTRSDAKDRSIGLGQGAVAATRRGTSAASVSAACLVPGGAFGYLSYLAGNYMQERTYWCGPASARQSLSLNRAWSGSTVGLPSQATLAGRIGTTTDGSSTSGIASALNSYDGIFGNVFYVASNLTDQSDPLYAFYARIGSMLRYRETCPVILTDTRYVPRYGGHYSRHYMSVCGVDDRTAPVKMKSVDPNCSTAYFGVSWDPVGCTSTNGLFRACYQADVNGTNLAMAW